MKLFSQGFQIITARTDRQTHKYITVPHSQAVKIYNWH